MVFNFSMRCVHMCVRQYPVSSLSSASLFPIKVMQPAVNDSRWLQNDSWDQVSVCECVYVCSQACYARTSALPDCPATPPC